MFFHIIKNMNAWDCTTKNKNPTQRCGDQKIGPPSRSYILYYTYIYILYIYIIYYIIHIYIYIIYILYILYIYILYILYIYILYIIYIIFQFCLDLLRDLWGNPSGDFWRSLRISRASPGGIPRGI